MLEFSRVTLPPLWTLDQAKAHLRITGTAHDADVQQKLAAAQDAILANLNLAADVTWTPETVPPLVAHMILVLLGYYYEDRGDSTLASPWPKIHEALGPYRDPTVK